MQKSIIFIGIILFLGIIFCFAGEPPQNTDSVTITTYYPSPYGVYKELRLYPSNTSSSTCDVNAEGAMYYDDASNQLKLCRESPPFTYEWVGLE